jgi:hypothetical protein
MGLISDIVEGVLYLENAPFVTVRSSTSTADTAPVTDLSGLRTDRSARYQGLYRAVRLSRVSWKLRWRSAA